MPDSLTEDDWTELLKRIDSGKCTPFLGAGACHGSLPLGADIASDWADKYDCPLPYHREDLARVAQFLAVTRNDDMSPKEELCARFRNCDPPNFDEADEPHAVLASLPLPVFVTTNYDDFMVRALAHRQKEPVQEMCLWNSYVVKLVQERQLSRLVLETGFEPTMANPVVYHLHGHFGIPESMVLTETDYVSFLVAWSKRKDMIPPRIQRAFSGASLLFVGYSLEDWTFRVLMRALVSSLEAGLRRVSVAVQLVPETVPQEKQQHAQDYLRSYFHTLFKVSVYWGTAREFAGELAGRWRRFREND